MEELTGAVDEVVDQATEVVGGLLDSAPVDEVTESVTGLFDQATGVVQETIDTVTDGSVPDVGGLVDQATDLVDQATGIVQEAIDTVTDAVTGTDLVDQAQDAVAPVVDVITPAYNALPTIFGPAYSFFTGFMNYAQQQYAPMVSGVQSSMY